jgi:hypothetical protein
MCHLGIRQQYLDKGVHLKVRLTDPSGIAITPAAGGTQDLYHTIYSITNPLEGVWEISWDGPGVAQYWVAQQYSTVQISTAAPFPYVGQEVAIQASIIRNGVMVRAPFRLEMDVSSPKTKVTVSLSPLGDGKYTGLFKPDVEGVYTLTARVFLADQMLNMRQAPTSISILPLVIPPTATFPPQPTSVPTLAPVLTPLETRVIPTPTSNPTVWWRAATQSVFSTIEENLELAGMIMLLVGIAVAVFAWNRRTATSLESRLGRANTAEAKIEALKEWWDMLVEKSTADFDKTGDKLAEGLTSLSRDKTIPVTELYRSYVEKMARPEVVSGKGAGKSLVDFLHWKGEEEILVHYLGIEKQGRVFLEEKNSLKEKEEIRQSISQSLMAAASYADRKKEESEKKAKKELSDQDKEQLKVEVRDYERISYLMRFASKVWGPTENYPSELPQSIETMVKNVLSTLPLSSKYRDDFSNLFETMSELLRGFSYNRDAVPVRSASALSASKQIAIGEGVMRVTQSLVNQHLYPLRPFIDNLDKANKKLTDEVELTVPEQGMLKLLLAKWKEAAEADLLEKKAQIRASAVASWAYVPPDNRSYVLRIILSNDSMVGSTVGEAENVSVTIEDDQTGETYSASNMIRRILPRESGVRCDVPLGLSASAGVDTKKFQIRISCEDLAIGRRIIVHPLSVDFRKWRPNAQGEDQYDPTALDELNYATAKGKALVDRIENQLKGRHKPIFLSDIQEVVEELASSPSTFQPEWEALNDEERRVLGAISRLTSEELFHVKLFEIGQEILRCQEEPFNWSAVAASLVKAKWLVDDRGIFRFSGRIHRKWVAHHSKRDKH